MLTQRRTPFKVPPIRPVVGADAEPDVILPQVPRDGVGGAQLVELVEDQSDDGPDLLVRVQRQAAGRRLHVPDRRVDEQFAPAGLVQFAADQAAADRMELQFRDLALQPEQEPVVGIGRVVDPVLVGQQGAEDAADLQQVVPVLAGPREAAHLQPQDQPDMVHA